MSDRLISVLAEAGAAAGGWPNVAARLSGLARLVQAPPPGVEVLDALACVAGALPALSVPALVNRSSAYAAALTAIRDELAVLDVTGPADLGARAPLLIEALAAYRAARVQVDEAARGEV